MMCRLLLASFLFLFLCSSPLSAVNDYAFGALGGVVISFPNNTSMIDENQSFTGFTCGEMAEVRVNSTLWVRASLIYRQEGAWYYPIAITDIWGNPTRTIRSHQDIRWFEIPIMLKLVPYPDPLHPYILAGFNMYILTRGFSVIDDFMDSSDQQVLYEKLYTDYTDKFTGIVVGFTAGAGAGYYIPGFAEVFIEGRYACGFTSIHRSFDRTNPSIALYTGLAVRL